MVRAPFQVLIFPYRQRRPDDWEFAIFQRADLLIWQGIAGGGEGDETPLAAARRESFEEAGIGPSSSSTALQSTASVKVTAFRESVSWDACLYVVPEYGFGVEVTGSALVRSAEHSAIRRAPFEEAELLLRFDSNRTALWELNQRIRGLGPHDPPV